MAQVSASWHYAVVTPQVLAEKHRDKPVMPTTSKGNNQPSQVQFFGTPITFPEDETFDIGQDTRTPLALIEYRYDVPCKFIGKIDKLTIKLEPEPLAASKR